LCRLSVEDEWLESAHDSLRPPEVSDFGYKTNYYDQLPYPRGYGVPEFAKVSGEDGKTTLEHIDQFILQCGDASANDTLKLRMFSLSLSGTTFTWFTSLAPNSIFTWAEIRTKVS
jgi:hypothetical protein